MCMQCFIVTETYSLFAVLDSDVNDFTDLLRNESKKIFLGGKNLEMSPDVFFLAMTIKSAVTQNTKKWLWGGFCK